jgi:parallel beta-helix repeat protein
MGIGMGKSAVLLLVLVLFASSTESFLPVQAGTRIIIVPDDYSTIEAAIANANNGDKVFIREGTYEGPLNQTLMINKAIALYGDGKNTTTINLSPPLVQKNIFTFYYMDYLPTIQINSSNVKITGLTINTPGGGISAIGDEIQIIGITAPTGISIDGSKTIISGNTLKGDLSVVGDNNTIAHNLFYPGVAPSVHLVGSFNAIVNNTLSSENDTSNIKLEIEGANNVITSNLLRAVYLLKGDNNLVYKNYIKAMPGDSGVYLSHSSRNTIAANRITYAESLTYEQEGIFLSESHDNVVYANQIESLFKGVYLQNTDKEPMITNNNAFYHNNFVNNKIQAWDYTSSTTNNFDNGKEGNYWSDYDGKDSNNDGIGDTQFKPTYVYTYDHIVEKITKCNPDNYPLMAPFDIDSVVIKLPDWASSEPQASEPKTTEPFPTVPVAAASVASVALAAAGVLIYFRKRKRQAITASSSNS